MGKLLRSRSSDLNEVKDGDIVNEEESNEDDKDTPHLHPLVDYVLRLTDEDPASYDMNRDDRQIYMKTPRVGRAKRSLREQRMLPRMGYRQLDNEEDQEDEQDIQEEQEKRAMPLPRLGLYARGQRAAPLPRLGLFKKAVDMLRMGRASPQLMERVARRVSMLRMGKRAVSMLRMGRSNQEKRRVSMLRMGRAVSMLRMGKRSAE